MSSGGHDIEVVYLPTFSLDTSSVQTCGGRPAPVFLLLQDTICLRFVRDRVCAQSPLVGES